MLDCLRYVKSYHSMVWTWSDNTSHWNPNIQREKSLIRARRKGNLWLTLDCTMTAACSQSQIINKLTESRTIGDMKWLNHRFPRKLDDCFGYSCSTTQCVSISIDGSIRWKIRVFSSLVTTRCLSCTHEWSSMLNQKRMKTSFWPPLGTQFVLGGWWKFVLRVRQFGYLFLL